MKKTIFDIGMHTGRDTEFYLKKGFNVIAVEANPTLASQARTKFKKEIENNQLTVIEKAIAPEGVSEIEFYINKDKDDWGTILPEWNRSMNSNYESIKVKTIQLETLIASYGVPYFMKIDIEGADVLCLQSLLKMNVMPDFISVELLTSNNLKGKKVDCLALPAHLYCIGYRNFKISDQSKNQDVKCPNPALEGEFVDFTFGGDTSGLFGKELIAPSFSFDELSAMYLDFFYPSETSNPNLIEKILHKVVFRYDKKVQLFHENGWFDVHASK